MAPSECVGAAPSRPLCVPAASCTLTHTSIPARPAFRVGTHASARALARTTRPASPGCTLLCTAADQNTARQGSATKTIQQLEGGAQRNSHTGIRMRHGALGESKLSCHALQYLGTSIMLILGPGSIAQGNILKSTGCRSSGSGRGAGSGCRCGLGRGCGLGTLGEKGQDITARCQQRGHMVANLLSTCPRGPEAVMALLSRWYSSIRRRTAGESGRLPARVSLHQLHGTCRRGGRRGMGWAWGSGGAGRADRRLREGGRGRCSLRGSRGRCLWQVR